MKIIRETFWSKEGDRLPTTELEPEAGDRSVDELLYLVKSLDVPYYAEFLPRLVLQKAYDDEEIIKMVTEGEKPLPKDVITQVNTSGGYL